MALVSVATRCKKSLDPWRCQPRFSAVFRPLGSLAGPPATSAVSSADGRDLHSVAAGGREIVNRRSGRKADQATLSPNPSLALRAEMTTT